MQKKYQVELLNTLTQNPVNKEIFAEDIQAATNKIQESFPKNVYEIVSINEERGTRQVITG